MKQRPLNFRKTYGDNIVYFVINNSCSMVIKSDLKKQISYAIYPNNQDDYFSQIGMFLEQECGAFKKISEAKLRELYPHLFK